MEQDQQKRLLLALGLSFALVTVWTFFFAPKPPPPTALVADAGQPTTEVAAPPKPVEAAAPDAGTTANIPVVTTPLDFKEVHYLVTSDGAGLARAQLQGEKMREVERLPAMEGFKRAFSHQASAAPQVDMALPVPGESMPLAVSIEGDQPFPAGAHFRVESASPKKMVLAAADGNWKVTKSLEWSDEGGGQFLMEIALENLTDHPATGELAIHYVRAVDPLAEEKPSFFGGVGNLSKASCNVAEKVQKLTPNNKPPPEYKGPIRFFGIDQQYFTASVLPPPDQREGRCVLTATPTSRKVVAYFPVTVKPKETVRRRYGVYIGPKGWDELSAVAAPKPEGAFTGDASPHLEKQIEFGIWEAICRPLLAILKFFHGLFSNWGVAIIFLTILVKLVLLPLTHKSLVSAEAMKKLQPKMEEIKKKFADDRERQNMEMMKLYQEAKVNPLGGCFPMLIQTPIWFALYATLRNTFEIYREPFIAPMWIDLTSKDPTYILPLVLGITMILTQRLQPQMTVDQTQAKLMTYAMPAFFSVLMINYPAGLALYIFTNNLLSIAQQYGLRRYIKAKEAK